MKPTTAVILETRRKLSDDTFPVKLRITYEKKQKYYTLSIKTKFVKGKQVPTGLTKEEWSSIFTERPRKPYSEYRDTINKLHLAAQEIVKEIPEFSFEAFEAKYFKSNSKVDLIAAMTKHATELEKEGNIKTAEGYFYAVESIKKFINKDKLLFTSVTIEWLNKYQKYMMAQKRSPTTISMYLRAVRATFNRTGITEKYPFGKNKYKFPESNNVKKALHIKDIAKIYRYETADPSKERSRDLWILSYLCNGMNFKDLALLKYKNVDGEAITFRRAKTAHKVNKPVVVPLTKEIGYLLDKYGTHPKTPENYILPILSDGMTPQEQRTAIDNTIRLVNKHIKVIAANIGINTNVSTYAARHSFASVMKRFGASTEFISESLGHRDVRTTENYLANFELDKKREMAAILTNFDNG